VNVRGLLFVLACALSAALPAVAADFAIPPTPDHYVVDNAGALSSATRASLENELQAYEKSTGHQIVVFIGQSTGSVPLETWTVETANQWKIGHKGKEDGAVLFVFMKDHKARIEVGYGLEGKLPDADASRIITGTIVPKMRAGDVDGAIAGGAAAMLTTITPGYKSTSPAVASQETGATGNDALLIVVILLFFFLIAIAVVGTMVANIRYGYLVMREGKASAQRDMKGWWFWGGVGSTGFFSGWSSGGGGGFGGGGGGGGFSAGGGSFGGGGASGGW
jgi:uncharacterized protein